MTLSLLVRRSAAGLLVTALGTAGSAAAQPTPVGSEFQVNTYTTSPQAHPSVAADATGAFVVVWESWGSFGDDNHFRSVQGQRYDSTGSAVGGEFQVNTYTTSDQMEPSVAADGDGDFVVVWTSLGSFGGDTSFFSIQGRRYASSGSAVGSEFQVNTYTTSYQTEPVIAADADGDFVVVWQSNGSSGGDTDGTSIQVRRYASSGSAVGGQFQVNTHTTSAQAEPSVAADADGDFVVVWYSVGSSGSDTSSYSIQGQRYDSAGSAVGSQFQVNTYTTSHQYRPSVSTSADGDFVVVWDSFGSLGSDASGYSIQGQRFDSSGGAIGAEFQVNTYTTGHQFTPSVAADADGDFIVVWRSRGSSGSDTFFESIQGQRYDGAGSAMGSQLQVNSYTTDYQGSPSVTARADGDFVVVWTSLGSSGGDTSSFSIQGQRFTTLVEKVPSLSPAGFAAAALLLCLAVALVLRRA